MRLDGRSLTVNDGEVPFKKIAIIGLGLMGASLAQAILNRWPAQSLVGWDANPETLDIALQNQWINEVFSLSSSSLSRVDFIILALPVSATIDWIEAFPNHCMATAQTFRRCKQFGSFNMKDDLPPMIMDLCSIKTSVVDAMVRAIEICDNWTWIGGHPLCGSEINGIHGAKADLYKDSRFFLTQVAPEHKLNDRNAKRLEEWLIELEAIPEWVCPQKHDEALAFTSHMPHMLSAALVRATQEAESIYRGPGYRDMTRIASGDPMLWQDILQHNKSAVMHAINLLESELCKIKGLLSEGTMSETQAWLTLPNQSPHPVNAKGG